MTELAIFQVDAFTDQPFQGNPAAVMPLDDWLPDGILQAIAAENNLSETAFFVGDDGRYRLRWFTPTTEVKLCGHATLASSHVIFRHIEPEATELIFDTLSGELRVIGLPDGRIEMDFPAHELGDGPAEASTELVEALGATPVEYWTAREAVAVFDSEAQVRALDPDFRKIAELDAYAVIATAPGNDTDFVSRFFAPRQGIDEDPVTGSAHCSLGPLWAKKLGQTTFSARQVSARSGDLEVEVRGERVVLRGHAVEVLRGTMILA